MNVLFVGLGSIGQRHLRNLLTLKTEGLNLFAYRVKNAQFVLDNKLNILDGATLENHYQITVCRSLEEAWTHQINLIFICNPNHMHYDILLQAAQHSCDIFVEKPVSVSTEGLDVIEDLCAQKELVTFVGYQNRFHPCIEGAKQILDSHEIGHVVAINAEIGEDVRIWHKYEDYRTMYACHKDQGGGVVLCQIHELDYIPYLLSSMPESVFAVGGKLSDLELDVEDVASILLSFEIDGRRIPVHIHEDYLQNPPSRCCKIIGSEGRIEFDLLNARLIQYDAEGRVVLDQTYTFERNDMFIKEMQLFLNAVETRRESCLPLQEGIKSLRIAQAAKQSLETHTLVRIQ